MSGAVEGVEAHARELAHRIIMEFRPNGWEAKENELYRLLLGSFEHLTTPPARSYADEDVARIIDPQAFGEVEILRSLGSFDERPQRQRAALAKAAAIRLLSQGEKA